MNYDQIIVLSQLIAAIAVTISVVYLAIQVRQGIRVNGAKARHDISQFVLDISIHRAENADRWARVISGENLTEGDRQFRWWNHMMIFLHAETYFHHYQLKLMPKKHWIGYKKYVTGYLSTPGVLEFWQDVGPAFSVEFSKWVDHLIEENS